MGKNPGDRLLPLIVEIFRGRVVPVETLAQEATLAGARVGRSVAPEALEVREVDARDLETLSAS